PPDSHPAPLPRRPLARGGRPRVAGTLEPPAIRPPAPLPTPAPPAPRLDPPRGPPPPGYLRLESRAAPAPPRGGRRPLTGPPRPLRGARTQAAGRVALDPLLPPGGNAMAPASDPAVFIGIDWATRAHEACATDRTGRVLGRREFPATPEGLEALVAWMLGLAAGEPTALAVAIERPDGLVVEALLDHGLAVFAINPKQL